MNSRIWLVILLFWLVVGTILSWYLLCCDGSCKPISPASISNKISFGSWIINDEPNFNVTSKDQLLFKRNEGTFITPLSSSLDSALLATSQYLKGKEGRKLNIAGYYHYNEVNSDSTWDNLGLMRANQLKKHLVNLGAPPAQINTEAKLMDGNWFNGDTLAKGVFFYFSELLSTDTTSANTAPHGRSMSIYFNTNKAYKSLTTSEKVLINELIDYLTKVPDSKINVYGHTDNRGSIQMNIALSKARAEFARNYLNGKGKIDNTRMDVKGFGFDQPSADNATADGRAINRRVDITLK